MLCKQRPTLPSLAEQRKIVTQLDALSKEISMFIKNQSEGRAILSSLEPSFFREAFLNQ